MRTVCLAIIGCGTMVRELTSTFSPIFTRWRLPARPDKPEKSILDHWAPLPLERPYKSSLVTLNRTLESSELKLKKTSRLVFDTNIQTTVDIYDHIVPGSNRNAVNKLDDEGDFGLRTVKGVG